MGLFKLAYLKCLFKISDRNAEDIITVFDVQRIAGNNKFWVRTFVDRLEILRFARIYFNGVHAGLHGEQNHILAPGVKVKIPDFIGRTENDDHIIANLSAAEIIWQ